MKNKLNAAITLLVIAFCVMIGNPQPVQAANPKTVSLKPNKTYTGYDITGDQKKDKIKICIANYEDGRYKNASVMINGKRAYRITNAGFYPEITAELYTMQNGKPFLFLVLPTDNGDGIVNAIFQYKSGSLKKEVDFHNLFKGYGGHLQGHVKSVKGNILYTEYSVMSWALGPCTMNVNYKYSSGGLKRTSNHYSYKYLSSTGKDAKVFYANRSIKAYTKAVGTQSAFTIKKGGEVTILQAYRNGGTMRIQVKYNGKTGWINAQSKYMETGRQFSNVVYVG